jgi:adenosylcobinamide-GDP ribazoletransferase
MKTTEITPGTMSPLAHFTAGWTDLKVALIFLTRLPLRHEGRIAGGELGRALRTGPLVGVLVGLVGAAGFWAAGLLALPPLLCGLIAVAATILFTGALHEDGLADTADGFGGGVDRARKLEIMRDSRIGAYGVVALILSIGLRAGALAALATPAAAGAALVAAHAVARAALPAAMIAMPPARKDGLAATGGRPAAIHAANAVILAGLLGLLALGPGAGLAGLLAGAGGALAVIVLARAQIGGYTGDVLGAVQQAAEIAVLLAAAASL